jgi:hypothetical protein
METFVTIFSERSPAGIPSTHRRHCGGRITDGRKTDKNRWMSLNFRRPKPFKIEKKIKHPKIGHFTNISVEMPDEMNAIEFVIAL